MTHHFPTRSSFRAAFRVACAAGIALGGLTTATGASPGDIRLDARLGQTVLTAGKTQRVFVRVSLEGLTIESNAERSPVNIALVLDRSGSMRGKKLFQAKEAAIMALSRLDRNDVTSIVVYDHNVATLVPATRLSNRRRIRNLISNIEAGGRTALYAGVKRGLREVGKFRASERVNRIILLSDGLANVGPSSPSELARLGQKAGGKGISVTTIGLGLDYNEDLMVRLAGASDGNHAFVEHAEDLAGIFDREFGDVLSVVAQDIEIIIKCRKGFRPIRLLGRDAEINGQTVKMRYNQIYGSQQKYVLLEVEVPANKAIAGQADLASVEIAYTSMRSNERQSVSGRVAAKFSTSKDEVKASTDKDVMTAVTTQIATINSEEAVKRRDSGDTKGARKILEDNASYLRKKAKQYNAPGLLRMGRESSDTASKLSESEWTRSRKTLRARQYKQKNQQRY